MLNLPLSLAPIILMLGASARSRLSPGLAELCGEFVLSFVSTNGLDTNIVFLCGLVPRRLDFTTTITGVAWTDAASSANALCGVRHGSRRPSFIGGPLQRLARTIAVEEVRKILQIQIDTAS